MAKEEVLIKKAKQGEPLLSPFSELTVLENLLKATSNSSGSRNALRLAGYRATVIFGEGWTSKAPEKKRDGVIRELLHEMVIESTPDRHPNKYMRWTRFQEYGRVTFLDKQLHGFGAQC